MANREGHMINFATRMLIVVTIVVSIHVVVAVMLILNHRIKVFFSQ